MQQIKILFTAVLFIFLASSVFAQSENTASKSKAACSTSATSSCNTKETSPTGVSTISNSTQQYSKAVDIPAPAKSEAGCCGSENEAECSKMSEVKKESCNSSVTKTASVETHKEHNKDCKCADCAKS